MYSAFLPSKTVGTAGQRGAALILALVVFGVVALLASSLGLDLLVSMRRVENQLYGQQATAYLRGAEGLARSVLLTDFSASNTKDHRSEGWLDSPQEFAMDTGVIRGVICDLQGRFNLNNLADKAPTPGTYTINQEIFIRLLQTLDLESPLDQDQATALTSAVIDWIDTDSDLTGVDGAEESYYSDREPAYHAGNQRLHEVSELRWVKGMTEEIYIALEPNVVALPDTTQLNINTAGARLLRSLNEAGNLAPLGPTDAASLLGERDGNSEDGDPANVKPGFDSVPLFLAAYPLAASATSVLTVRSDYYLLDSILLFLDRTYRQAAVIHRDSAGKIKTLARGQRGLGRCQNES